MDPNYYQNHSSVIIQFFEIKAFKTLIDNIDKKLLSFIMVINVY